ncbi:hypothetical protein EON65_30520 [archaeon]|nr:MAG: hypothetical protein EON65_30520 [archaeon]
MSSFGMGVLHQSYQRIMAEAIKKRPFNDTANEVDGGEARKSALRKRKRRLPPIQRSLSIILASLQGKCVYCTMMSSYCIHSIRLLLQAMRWWLS